MVNTSIIGFKVNNLSEVIYTIFENCEVDGLKTLLLLLMLFFTVLIWSVVNHFDYFTWLLEAIPAIVAVTILALTFKKFRFTNMTYIFIFIHCCILFVGAKYTYAEVPLFNHIQEYFGHARNNYDKIGHFAQGFNLH